MRDFGNVDTSERCRVVVQPLHREAVQVDEIARYVQSDQLSLTAPIVEVAQDRTFDNVVGMLDTFAALDQRLTRLEPDRPADCFFQPRLLLHGEFVPEAAFKEKFGVQGCVLTFADRMTG